MKKVILLAGILVFGNLSAFAIIDSDYTTSEQYLKNCGYSKETIRLIQLKKKSPYAPIEVEEKTVGQKTLGGLKSFWRYLDPAADNHRFGEGEISPDAARPDVNL